MNRWDIINSFIEKHNFKSYLEIGYYKGWSFDRVFCEKKLAVDPNPCKNEWQQSYPYGVSFEDSGLIYKQTSNDFFDLWRGDKWDIIFIDGLHEAEQVMRDIHNSLNYLKPGGIIVMHDCNPPEFLHTTTGINGCWTGDTYKAWVKYRAESPYFTYTIDTDWGVGVIDTKKSAILHGDLGYLRYLEEIYSMQWDLFDKNRKELLNLISVEEFKTKMNERTENNNSPA